MKGPMVLAALATSANGRSREKVASWSVATGLSTAGAFFALLILFGWKSPAKTLETLARTDTVLFDSIAALRKDVVAGREERKALADDIDLLVFSACTEPGKRELARRCEQRGRVK